MYICSVRKRQTKGFILQSVLIEMLDKEKVPEVLAILAGPRKGSHQIC